MCNRYVLFFLFLLVFAVNLVFIYISKQTFSGNITDDAYNKGLKYNEVILAESEQKSVLEGLLSYEDKSLHDNKHLILLKTSSECERADFHFFFATKDTKDFVIEIAYSSDSYVVELDKHLKGPWLVRAKCYIKGAEYYFSNKFNFM